MGEFSQIKVEGAIGGPLGEAAAGRFAFATHQHDDFTRNRFPGAPDYNETDSQAVRGQLAFRPSERIDVLVGAYWSDNDAAAEVVIEVAGGDAGRIRHAF